MSNNFTLQGKRSYYSGVNHCAQYVPKEYSQKLVFENFKFNSHKNVIFVEITLQMNPIYNIPGMAEQC